MSAFARWCAMARGGASCRAWHCHNPHSPAARARRVATDRGAANPTANRPAPVWQPRPPGQAAHAARLRGQQPPRECARPCSPRVPPRPSSPQAVRKGGTRGMDTLAPTHTSSQRAHWPAARA
eukprot:2016458-Prymnesium_polylepis.1